MLMKQGLIKVVLEAYLFKPVMPRMKREFYKVQVILSVLELSKKNMAGSLTSKTKPLHNVEVGWKHDLGSKILLAISHTIKSSPRLIGCAILFQTRFFVAFLA